MPKINRTTYRLPPLKEDKPSRRHSYSEGCKTIFQDKLVRAENSSLNLIRSKGISNLTLAEDMRNTNGLVAIKYEDSKLEEIDAKNYIYCGSAQMLPINNIGMSIDKNGDLVLIKGDSYDFFEGLFKKYITGYTYKTSLLNSDTFDYKFQSLYMDDDGILIGIEQKTGRKYMIKMSPPEIDVNNQGQFIKLDFEDYTPQKTVDNLTFIIDKDHTASYFTKNNKLYLKSLSYMGNEKNYSFLFYEIDIPLRQGYTLSNIKRTMGILQLETRKGNKIRLLYVDPKHISNHDFKVRKVSHKPPQSFSSRIGNDPHEKYHAGQPFSSDRIANFSSRHIPLFSTIIDNFRVNVKKAKDNHAEGNDRKAITYAMKSIDPFISGITATMPSMIKTAASSFGNDLDKKELLYKKNTDILKSNSKPLSKLTNDALGVDKEQKFSDSLINLLNEIQEKDTLHLTSTDRIAAFFGIASGGIPFISGWFAGVVLELSNSHNLSIEKKENGNIKISFTNRHKTAATALAGTGQGLEKTLLNTSGVDYMTVMPIEANAIITAQCVLGDNFSFDMSEEQFRDFVEQFSTPHISPSLKNIINEAEAEKIKDKEFCIKIEAKSEFRLQEGSMVNTSTYMVMPRTAIGISLALDLLSIKSHNAKSLDSNEKKSYSTKKNIKVTALDYDASLFAQWNIMPIAMSGGGDNTLWCYPLPLLEEAKRIAQYKNKKPMVILDKSTEIKKTQNPSNNIALTEAIASIKKIPVLITADDTGNVKPGLKLKYAAKVNECLNEISHIIGDVQKKLINMERNSQNKSSTAIVIAHYESIASPSILIEEETDIPLTNTKLSKHKGFRLKKLEFRRISSLQHQKATIPLPIISFSNKHLITHNQFIGDIEFHYNSNGDVSPVNAKSNLNLLY